MCSCDKTALICHRNSQGQTVQIRITTLVATEISEVQCSSLRVGRMRSELRDDLVVVLNFGSKLDQLALGALFSDEMLLLSTRSSLMGTPITSVSSPPVA